MRLALLALPFLAACAHHGPIGGGTTVMPTGEVFLRSSFDADASSYLGRFVPPGTTAPDETTAMPLACSQYVSQRFVDGGGVKYSELFQLSQSVAAQVGTPIVSAKASAQRSQVARVDYELTGKLVTTIADPAAFAQCCSTQPSGCTDRYVGEMLQGRGTIYRQVTSGAAADANALTTQGTGAISASHGQQWEQAIEFPNPVYFGFKLTNNPYKRVTSICGDWVDHPPVAPGGRYYVAKSGAAKTEEQAKTRALREAWQQAWIANGGPAVPVDTSAPADATADPLTAWVLTMQQKEWCVESAAEGKFTATVLGWLPDREDPASTR
jgi:hypothetical protein